MRKRFTRAFYAVSAAAAVTASLSLGAGAASAGTHATKGTEACGFNCINFFSKALGPHVTENAFVPGDTGSGGKVGQKINLHLFSNTRPNGDFTPDIIAHVSSLCGSLFASTSYVCMHFPNFWVFEFNWSPFGNQSGLCVGVAVAQLAGQNVTLQPCGASTRTLWIADRAHGTNGDCRIGFPPFFHFPNFCPWINGSDTQFSHPLVLTLDTGTSHPTNQLFVRRQNLLTNGQSPDNQEFTFFFGDNPPTFF